MQTIRAAANTLDDNSWLPLHHAVRTLQHWSFAVNVCRGLMAMTQRSQLQLRTERGGPPDKPCCI